MVQKRYLTREISDKTSEERPDKIVKRNISGSCHSTITRRSPILHEVCTNQSPSKSEPRVPANFKIHPDDPHEVNQRDLRNLLDFSALTLHSEISSRFDEIAELLLWNYHLSLKCRDEYTEYEILELEFYLKNSGCHEDPYTHCSNEQETSGQWYFHRAPTTLGSTGQSNASSAAGGYKGGTRKGLDLTIGASANVISSYFSSPVPERLTLRGGILLRTLRRTSDSKVISGPSLLVDEILLRSHAANISELVTVHWKNDISAFLREPLDGPEPSPSSLYLQRKQLVQAEGRPCIHRSPRVGLDLSNPKTQISSTDLRVFFVAKFYRYFTCPHLLTSNGRAHTLIGVYYAMKTSGIFPTADSLSSKLSEITNLKKRTIEDYITHYELGLQKGNLESFVGANGKGVSSSPSRYLRLLGTLTKFLDGHA